MLISVAPEVLPSLVTLVPLVLDPVGISGAFSLSVSLISFQVERFLRLPFLHDLHILSSPVACLSVGFASRFLIIRTLARQCPRRGQRSSVGGGGAAQVSCPCPFLLILLLFSHQAVFDSSAACGLQHARLPCPSPSLGVCPNSCALHP